MSPKGDRKILTAAVVAVFVVVAIAVVFVIGVVVVVVVAVVVVSVRHIFLIRVMSLSMFADELERFLVQLRIHAYVCGIGAVTSGLFLGHWC